MLLDEWHLQVTVPSSVSPTDVETITTIANTLLEPFGAQLEATLRQCGDRMGQALQRSCHRRDHEGRGDDPAFGVAPHLRALRR